MIFSKPPENRTSELKVCAPCNGTGQADKVKRIFWTEGTCMPCRGTGWVNPRTGARLPDSDEWYQDE